MVFNPDILVSAITGKRLSIADCFEDFDRFCMENFGVPSTQEQRELLIPTLLQELPTLDEWKSQQEEIKNANNLQ